MNKSLKLSIVTPSYNQGRYIEKAILSVKNQDYPNVEHIIMDGGSTDNTIEILKRYPHLNWVSEPDKGQTEAGNKAIRIASGDIIGWLNTDDLYFENVFGKIMKVFRTNGEVDIVYGDYHWIDQNGTYIKQVKERPFNLKRLLFHNYIAHPTVFMRKKVFDAEGLYRVDLNFSMDYEFWLRLATQYKIMHMPFYIAKLRLHPDCKTYLHREEQRSDYLIVTKIYANLFAKARRSKISWGCNKFYYMGLKEMNELTYNPIFWLKKICFHCVKCISMGRFTPGYTYRINY